MATAPSSSNLSTKPSETTNDHRNFIEIRPLPLPPPPPPAPGQPLRSFIQPAPPPGPPLRSFLQPAPPPGLPYQQPRLSVEISAAEELKVEKVPFPFFRPIRQRGDDIWVISLFVILHFCVFTATMIVNDCWRNSHGQCALRPLGRMSFQPLSENPLLGPSASAWVSLSYNLILILWLYRIFNILMLLIVFLPNGLRYLLRLGFYNL